MAIPPSYDPYVGEYPRRPDPVADSFDRAKRPGYKDGDELVVLAARAQDAQREKDLAHMAERLRDLAAMAQDDHEPSLELDVFRLQLQLYSK